MVKCLLCFLSLYIPQSAIYTPQSKKGDFMYGSCTAREGSTEEAQISKFNSKVQSEGQSSSLDFWREGMAKTIEEIMRRSRKGKRLSDSGGDY